MILQIPHNHPITRHLYWGAMRDRIPMSATNLFENNAPIEIIEQSSNRVVVQAHENLCIIRFGQDWSQCDAEQMTEYQEVI